MQHECGLNRSYPTAAMSSPSCSTPMHFASGKDIPDQVIVSLSDADQVWRSTVNSIERLGSQLFPSFKLLKHTKTLKHGPNRQSAVEHSSSDVISFFDSDDLPYPNRIQALRKVFEDSAISHVNHGCTILGQPLFDNWPDDVPIRATSDDLMRLHFPNETQSVSDCSGSVYSTGLQRGRFSEEYSGIHSGHVTVRKRVFEKVSWKDWDELNCAAIFRASNLPV